MSYHQIHQLHHKSPLIFPTQRNVQKNLLEIKSRDHNTRQYPVLTVTKNIQKNILDRDRKIKTNIPNAPTTTIIGDSMIKNVFGDKLSRQLNYKHRVGVRSSDEAKTQYVEDYIKLNVKLSPKQIILHCRTNNLTSSEDSEIIAKNIINLAKNSKADTAKVTISGTIPWRDALNVKAKQVNETLKKICEEEKIPFISHHGINTRFYLNSRGLHLNDKVPTRLAQNFNSFLSDIEFG